MSEFKLTTVEEFEEATARLLETGAKVGADAWQFRVKNQTPHCKFGEQGVCSSLSSARVSTLSRTFLSRCPYIAYICLSCTYYNKPK